MHIANSGFAWEMSQMPLRILIISENNEKEIAQKDNAWIPRIDLSGKQYGFLRVIRPGPRKNGYPAWLCYCEACGTEKLVKAKDLRRGVSTHCGCLKKRRGVEQMHYVEGTCIEMLQNSKIRKNNTTGYTGVSYDRVTQKYRAEITLQGKRHFLGRFKTVEEAAKVREEAKNRYHQAFIDSHNDK